MTDERKLIERYAKSRSEAAFEGIVSRYVDLVYSVALRVVSGDPHLAKDVVQTVFIDLARKAERLANDNVVLAGWLCRHTFFVAASRIRTERRRREREREAAQMNTPATELEPDWEKLSAALDEALQRLRPGDRDAVVLRYFEGRDLKQVGAALGLSEDAAQKRVSRALQKLRQAFPKHGLALTAESLGLTLASNAVKGAPFGMAGHVTASALKAGAMG